MLTKLITSKGDKSPTNLILSFSGTLSALWFVWESNSQFPMNDPMIPEPGIFLDLENVVSHFTFTFTFILMLGLNLDQHHFLVHHVW